MMNGPFFRNYSDRQPSRSAGFFPVKQTQARSSPKVVSVPVHFISSEQPRTTLLMLKDSAAVKIQKVLRGFLVRKSVKKIVTIRNEVSEIERRINVTEVIDLIRRDAKERLRVNETLMSLLFKLDSVRGVDCGVRNLRKTVARKAIALQEKVDSIAKSDEQTLDPPNNNSSEIVVENVGTDPVTEASDCLDEVVDDSANLEAGADEGDGGVLKEVVDVQICNPVEAADGCGVETEDHASVEGSVEVPECDEGSRKLIVKLMAENEKMMKLMMQISERNEMQTRMINSLSRRVEQLEKALMSENLRRKKRRRVALRRRDLVPAFELNGNVS